MRLPFPERLPLRYVILFATILVSAQQLQGTDLVFSVYAYLFVIVAALAFNTTGGFTRPSGGYVFFYSLGVVVGLTGKAIVGEAADSNLESPNLTMQVFLGGITAMWVAVYIARKLRTREALLQNIVKPKDMRNATLGCAFTGITIAVLITFIPHGSGSVLSALNQVNQFLPMAIILGTTHQIRRSGGTSALSIFILLAAILMFGYSGVMSFSKSGMFTPLLCWVITAASMRFRMRLHYIVVLAFLFFILVYYFVPFSQYGRDAEGTGINAEGNFKVSVRLLQDLGKVREEYLEQRAEADLNGTGSYYNESQGLLDRLQILKPDDGLIAVTEERGTYGLAPIWWNFTNLIPHVFYPNKPQFLMGNIYAHEAGGILGDDDVSTGISFTPSGEAYHLAKWEGIFVVAPILWIMLFTLFDSLCGDVRKSPWGLLIIAVFSHAAPEGMLGGVIYMMGYVTVGLLFAALAAAYIMPIIGTLLIGPEQANQRRTVRLLSGVRLRRSLQRSPIAAEPNA
jgi:hypothetical protein